VTDEIEDSERDFITRNSRTPVNRRRPVASYRRTANEDDSNSDLRFDRRGALSPQPQLPSVRKYTNRRRQSISDSLEDIDLSDAKEARRGARENSAARMQRKSAEEEADEILRDPGLVRENRTVNFSHVNELVDLANNLRDDYYKLGRYLGQDQSADEVSIEHLSRMNESLGSAERGTEDLSD
jgi:hypothetical protein